MGNFNFKQFPELVTNRLVLRQPCASDSKSLYQLRTNRKINKLISRKIPQNIKETTKFIAELNKRFEDKKNIFWVIVSKEHRRVIGSIAYHNFNHNFTYAEIGYELVLNFHGKAHVRYLKALILQVVCFSRN